MNASHLRMNIDLFQDQLLIEPFHEWKIQEMFAFVDQLLIEPFHEWKIQEMFAFVETEKNLLIRLFDYLNPRLKHLMKTTLN